MEFKGTQGSLSIEVIPEDYYVNIQNEKGNSVAGISTNEEQYEEAIMYGNLFAHAPEMLEMLERLSTHDRLFSDEIRDIKELIEKATTI